MVCGNDFLPHLPSLDIGEGALDSLLRVYREQLGSWGDYLSNRGLVHVPSLERLLQAMGAMEEEVFAQRAIEAAKFEKKKNRYDRRAPAPAAVVETDDEESTGDELSAEARETARQAAADSQMLAAAASRLALQEGTSGPPDVMRAEAVVHADDDGGGAFTETRVIDRRPAAPVDNLNYKARYYWEKFGES